MRCSQRLISAVVAIALSGALAGCGSGGLGFSSFDPSDMLDFIETKKKLAGERKPVFPEGVPGLEQGVPKNLYRGSSQEQIDRQNAEAAAAASAAPAQEPKSKSRSKGKQPATASTAPASQEPAVEPDPNAEENTTPATPPDPKPKKIVRKRTTAPPPDQPAAQQSAAPFPAPMPGGTVTR